MAKLRVLLPLTIVAALFQLGTAAANASPSFVAYDAIPSTLPGNVASVGFEATSADEFGQLINLASDTPRQLSDATVVMSSWACETGDWTDTTGVCSSTPGDTFSWPITFNAYSVDSSSGTPEPGTLLGSVTQTFDLPYRPSSTPTMCGGDDTEWYDATDATCYHGYASSITFDLSSAGIVVPDQFIWSLAYNTNDYGPDPAHLDCSVAPYCPFNSLNVGAETFDGQPSVGSFGDPDSAYQSSTWGGAYCDSGAGGTGTFRDDTSCWTGYQPIAEIDTVGTETQPPVVTNVAGTPNPVTAPGDVSVSAIVSDASTGGSTIRSAEYNVDGGSWNPMSAADGAFDEVTEAVTATASGLSPGSHQICVRGTDSQFNTSDGSACVTVQVKAEPKLKFVSKSATVNEGDTASLQVKLSAASTQPVTVHYATQDVTAVAGTSYTGTAGTLTWAPGDHSTQTINVATLDDGTYGGTLTFHVTLSSPSEATIAGGTIATVKVTNIDPKPTLTINNVSAPEGDSGLTPFVFTVTQSAVSNSPTRVHYATSDGTATKGQDYVAVSGWLVIPTGQTTGTITVYVKGDTRIEPDETFSVTLTSPSGATLGTAPVGTGTILNDD